MFAYWSIRRDISKILQIEYVMKLLHRKEALHEARGVIPMKQVDIILTDRSFLKSIDASILCISFHITLQTGHYLGKVNFLIVIGYDMRLQ